MTQMSDYLEEALVDHIFRSTTFTKPTTLYFALCTAVVVDSDTGATITEVANSNGYARASLASADANWNAPSSGDGLTDNITEIVFGPASGGAWGTVTDIAIMDRYCHHGQCNPWSR